MNSASVVMDLFCTIVRMFCIDSVRQLSPQSTHRVAITTFWRTFHYDGKISLA
jgi:hypothetical protein